MSTASEKPAKKARPWRFYSILLHRYLGYFFLGITVVYALSGLAVNHVDQWNPNYISEKKQIQLDPLQDKENLSAAEAQVINAMGLLLPAITGLVMKKGKKGLWGEAGIWTVAGMILPVALILLYYR